MWVQWHRAHSNLTHCGPDSKLWCGNHGVMVKPRRCQERAPGFCQASSGPLGHTSSGWASPGMELESPKSVKATSAWCGSTYKRSFLCQHSFLYHPSTHFVDEAARCVEAHAGVESASACYAAVTRMTDNVHNLRHWILLHLAAHTQLQVGRASDLSTAGGIGAESVGEHHFTVLKLVKVEDKEK